MIVNFDLNAIGVFTGILAWSVIGFFAYQIYKKQMVKPKVWKILMAILVGLFSFSINWNMNETMFRIPILPLGVWILYFFCKGKAGRWQTYRTFAWLGFLMNFVFLFLTLVSIPIYHMIYSENEPSTYISTVENASIITIHPSAKNPTLKEEKLLKQLSSMSQEKIYSNQWYDDTYKNHELIDRKERFPYQLIGASPKWGSGLNTIIYIEDDGKGILISTPKKQLYFRSEESILERGE
ncbi:hypothetical protein [Neobacillus jeddahensis]|uniref:hypothetical protein n=1 Tax=Neobacillus jeddahensis TaxID=1461580 RepID=UPI00058C292D|nr:hypothetical protein [Neobacillus jeddahensis]